MKAGLTALVSALDAATAPVRVFIRDDDAGWSDESAVPPAGLCSQVRARPSIWRLFRRRAASNSPANCAGAWMSRRDELGCTNTASAMPITRRPTANASSAVRAASRISAAICSPGGSGYARCLELGSIRCLPRRGTAAARLCRRYWPNWVLAPCRGTLAHGHKTHWPEIPVDVDWCKQRRIALQRGEDDGDRMAREVALCVGAGGGTLGLMLHHAEMDQRDLLLLETLIAATSGHPKVQWALMAEVLRNSEVAGEDHGVVDSVN